MNAERDDCSTALHHVCGSQPPEELQQRSVRSKLDAVKLLVSRGCDVNAGQEHWEKKTPLHCAAEAHATDVVEFLLDQVRTR